MIKSTWNAIRELFGIFRRQKPLWAVVEPLGPDRGWEIRSVHPTPEEASIVMKGLLDAGTRVTVRRHDLVQRDNHEIAARVYHKD